MSNFQGVGLALCQVFAGVGLGCLIAQAATGGEFLKVIGGVVEPYLESAIDSVATALLWCCITGWHART